MNEDNNPSILPLEYIRVMGGDLGRYFSYHVATLVVTYAQLDSNIRVLYVFLLFFKNTAQNTQSGTRKKKKIGLQAETRA
jgi:hypothetical protein